MIHRKAVEKVLAMAEKFPVLVFTGPRQSGKTTLAKIAFPDYRYVSLENPENLAFALNDPKGFLEIYDQFVIIDEVQNAPELFSYIQEIVDNSGKCGHYILSGSQNFLLLEKITQTLAGRIYLMELLPLSHTEINQIKETAIEEELFSGSYPRLYNMNIEPKDFYPGYIKTYVERDVRTILNVQDIKLFRKLLSLLAHYAGQQFNASEIAKKLHIDSKTVQRWMSILEASYIAFTLEPWHANLSKRVVKTPKLYFYDTGLLCYLLGIKSVEELRISSYKGAIFENYVLLEILKSQHAQGNQLDMYYWRDTNQNEIDLLIVDGQKIHCIEMKASLTVRPEHIKALHYLDDFINSYQLKHYLVNFFEESQKRSNELILSWRDIEMKIN
jgi:predicted AAA+ superfamily ATPase